jgi:hypothetical protein
LLSIDNIAPNGTARSQFSYQYNSVGEITRWAQQNAGNTPQVYALDCDLASQLVSAKAGSGNAPPPYSNQYYYYAYDPGSNRTAVQNATGQSARIGGSVTAGDTLTLTVSDSSLSGGQEAVSYQVQSGDTLSQAPLTISLRQSRPIQTYNPPE